MLPVHLKGSSLEIAEYSSINQTGIVCLFEYVWNLKKKKTLDGHFIPKYAQKF